MPIIPNHIKILLLITACLLLFSKASGQEIEIVKQNINNSHSSEIAPLVHDSLLYFVSNRKNSIFTTIFNQQGEHLYRVYSAPLLNSGQTGKASLFNPAKTFNLTAGAVAFSASGMLQIATFNKTASYKEARLLQESSEIPLGLFEAHRTSPTSWSEYAQLPFSDNNLYTFTHPTLSADGETLIFASNMEGGAGQSDLYISHHTASGWSTPVNLGSKINSSGRELFPFIHTSGTLYFSSDRQGGQGGFDIYFSAFADGEWQEPVSLPSPVNSPYDDFSCYIFPDQTSGFFTSSREGNDDIYRFDYKMTFCDDATPVEDENYCFTFFEERAVEADTIPVKYQWRFSDGTTAMGIEVDHCFPGAGNYEVTLSVIDSVSNEQLYDVATYQLPLEPLQQVYFNIPEKINQNSEYTLKAALTGFGEVNNVRYFWSIDNEKFTLGETFLFKSRKKGSFRIRCEAYWGDSQKICSYRDVTVE